MTIHFLLFLFAAVISLACCVLFFCPFLGFVLIYFVSFRFVSQVVVGADSGPLHFMLNNNRRADIMVKVCRKGSEGREEERRRGGESAGEKKRQEWE